MIATAHDALPLIGWLIVAVCLVAAAIAGWRSAWLPCGLLVGVAVFAAVLLTGA